MSTSAVQGFNFLKIATPKDTMRERPSILDYKITQVALRVLSRLSFLAATILSVVTYIAGPFTFPAVLGIAGTVAFSLFLEGVYRKGCHHFSDEKELAKYRNTAMNIVDAAQYYQCEELIEHPDLESHMKRPLDRIFEKFSVESVFKYEILTPEAFKKAFMLQIKTMDIQESIKFYVRVKKIYTSMRLPKDHPKYEIPEPQSWGKTLYREFEQHTPFTFFHEVDLNLLKDHQLLTEGKVLELKEIQTATDDQYREFIEPKETKKALEKTYCDFRKSLTKAFEGHYAHSTIKEEQEFFYEKVKDLTKKLKSSLEPVKAKFDKHKKEASTWCEGKLKSLKGDDLILFKQFKLEYETEKSKILNLFKYELRTLRETFLRSIEGSLEKLENHKMNLERDYLETHKKVVDKLFPTASGVDGLPLRRQREFTLRATALSKRLKDALQDL